MVIIHLDRKIYKISFDEDKYVDILIVGGGGGGGYGGGGGAGDAKYFKNIKFTKGTYNITVGSGGLSGIIESNSSNGFQPSIEKKKDTKFKRIIVAEVVEGDLILLIVIRQYLA